MNTVLHSSRAPELRIITVPLLLFGLVFGVAQASFWHRLASYEDWGSLWVAGAMFHRGDTAELYDHAPLDFARIFSESWWRHAESLGVDAYHPFIHNPLVALVVGLGSDWISYPVSGFLLNALSGFLTPILLASVFFLWLKHPAPLSWVVIGTFILAISPPYQWILFLGQTSILIFCAVFYGLAASKTRPYIAGVALAFAGFVKLTPLALIPLLFFFRDRRRCGVVSLLSVVAMFGIQRLTTPKELFSQWRESVSYLTDVALVNGMNQSFTSFMLRNQERTDFGMTIVENPGTAALLLPLLIALCIGASLLLFAFVERSYAFEILSVGGLTLSTVFNQIFWTHYSVMIVGIAVGIVVLAPQPRIALAGVAAAAFLFFPPFSTTNPNSAFYNQAYLPYQSLYACLLLIGIFLAVLVLRRSAAARAPIYRGRHAR